RTLERKIDDIQKQLEQVDILSLRVKEQSLLDEYNLVLQQEEMLWAQKSRE
ncbi:hypothetical protein PIB30_103318, partial [Stylosanthes scabra]|nr:hypothetical protein [Stylosanthes scabra]